MHTGSPAEWLDLIDSHVPEILGVVVETWETLPPPAGNELEDPVTETLCRALRQSPRARTLPFQIHLQSVEIDPAEGQDQGRMDIAFYLLVPREDIYFCLECKRLNVREQSGVRHLFTEYVRQGMMRFVRGQYAKSVRNGGMLGFVLNGDVPGAIAGVAAGIKMNHAVLAMASPGVLSPSSVLAADKRICESLHNRIGDESPFKIHHMFMAGDPKAPLRNDA